MELMKHVHDIYFSTKLVQVSILIFNGVDMIKKRFFAIGVGDLRGGRRMMSQRWLATMLVVMTIFQPTMAASSRTESDKDKALSDDVILLVVFTTVLAMSLSLGLTIGWCGRGCYDGRHTVVSYKGKGGCAYHPKGKGKSKYIPDPDQPETGMNGDGDTSSDSVDNTFHDKACETDGCTELRFHAMVADDVCYVTSATTDVYHSSIFCCTIKDHNALRRLRHCKICCANAKKRT